MVVRVWQVLVVGAIAVSAVTALITFTLVGHSAKHETQTVALVAATLPADEAEATAQANVRSAVPSAEAFYADHGSFAGVTTAALHEYDSNIDPTVTVGWVDAKRYCLQSTVDGQTASVARGDVTGDGQVVAGGC